MSFTVAMVQSSYIPWKGYFHMIGLADLFVFYDDVAYTKEDWRNRNRIKTQNGTRWVTVPCGRPRGRRICDVEIPLSHWQRKHWYTIQQSYARAAHFDRYRDFFAELYLDRTWTMLSEMNQAFTKRISREVLGLGTDFADSRSYPIPDGLSREARWIAKLQTIGAERFIIGPAARGYLDEAAQQRVSSAGIELVWMDYSGYPEYDQLFPPFEHRVSIVDLVLNTGPDAPSYMGLR